MSAWRNRFERIGMPGIAGIGLLLFSLAFAAGSVLPLQEQLSTLASEQRTLEVAASARGPAAAAAQTRDVLLPLLEAPDLLIQLDALATKHGVVVEQTAYELKDSGRTLRLEVRMPLRASYPVLRGFLRDALLMNAVSLDELALQRDLATDAVVTAQVGLSYGLARTP